MLDSFIKWFSHINWVSWDSLASIGQIIGAVATVWTARIALKQVRAANEQIEEARKQNALAIKQMEEARKRELDARTPEVKINYQLLHEQPKEIEMRISVTNVKSIPVLITQYYITEQIVPDYYDELYMSLGIGISQKYIEADSPKNLTLGESFSIKFQLFSLVKAMCLPNGKKPSKKSSVFVFNFANNLGMECICSIGINREFAEEHGGYYWAFYFSSGLKKDIEEFNGLTPIFRLEEEILDDMLQT